AVQAQAATRSAADEVAGARVSARRGEDDAGLGIGEIRAEESRDHALVPGKAAQSRHRIGAQSGLDARGRTCRPAARIGVAAVERDAIAQPVEERDRDLLRRWRAEAD